MMSMYLPFRFLNQLTDVQEICYGCYAIGGHPKCVMFNFLQAIMKNGGRTKL